jgi:phenylalanyl-tRNA synthetase alpha chain
MKEQLTTIRRMCLSELADGATEHAIYQLKSKYLGRTGSLTHIVKNLKNIPPDERSAIGSAANQLKQELTIAVDEALQRVRQHKKHALLSSQAIDVTLPGRRHRPGSRHPVTQITDSIIDIFSRLGFSVVEGPEIELDFFNFEALNIPRDHPARDMHDTFYISDALLLRTHTSPVQIRTMQRSAPPLRIICPGKVYRCDSDVSHTPMFHQIEGLMVGTTISFADLKGLLTLFIHQMFAPDTSIRFRPSYFPFTEPSAEVDIQCVMCRGTGCRVCSGTGWLEILGCGLVHPKVFISAGYDPDTVTGLAFGLGVERITMLKFGINDIRLNFENDYRFLSQF